MPDPRAQRQKQLIDLFSKDPINQTYGMQLSFDEENRAVLDLPHNPYLDHALGAIHGGVFATLLDTVGWFAAAVQYEHWVVTVEFQTRLLEQVKKKPLRATGWLVRRGHTVAIGQMEVRTNQGQLVATGSGTFKVTGPPR